MLQGGSADSSFLTSYKAAVAAGFTDFDAYLYPVSPYSLSSPLSNTSFRRAPQTISNKPQCAGTPVSGCSDATCKTPTVQVAAFESAVASSGMKPAHLWLDLEPSTATSCSGCNTWDFGATANIKLAKEFVAAVKGSKYKWGVYANG